MQSSSFFKLFPPPKFLVMKYTGLHISDEAVYCLEYSSHLHSQKIAKFGHVDIPLGIMDGGNIKDEKAFQNLLVKFDHDHDLSYVKVSVPEEKAYLFQTDVPNTTVRAMAQNIESKLEESVPLAAQDALFYFDLLPQSVTGGATRASVSVVSRSYIEHYISLLRGSGIFPVAFEVLPKSIARAIIPAETGGAQLIVYIMNKKTGVYIVSGGVVCFTSTISWGSKSKETDPTADIATLTKEINRIYSYWATHSLATSAIGSILLVGRSALQFESILREAMVDAGITVVVADVWRNIFNLDKYIPPISKEESLDYAVVAGLGIV